MVVVCENCRPNWATVEEKTLKPLAPCQLCGGHEKKHWLVRDPGEPQTSEEASA